MYTYIYVCIYICIHIYVCIYICIYYYTCIVFVQHQSLPLMTRAAQWLYGNW